MSGGLCSGAGDKEMTEWLVENYPEITDIPNANGDLAVHFAAAQGKQQHSLTSVLDRHASVDKFCFL